MMLTRLLTMFKKLFGRKQKDSPSPHIQEGWNIVLHGEVIEVSKLNVDKSGRNPKYMLYLQLTVESVNKNEFNVELDSVVHAQGRESEILHQLSKLPEIGDHIIIHSSGHEKRPKRLRINRIEYAQKGN